MVHWNFKRRNKLLCKPCFGNFTTVGFFDGAQVNGLVGAVFLLRIKYDLIFKLHWGIGEGSNTRAELLALWVLLWFAKKRAFKEFMFWETLGLS